MKTIKTMARATAIMFAARVPKPFDGMRSDRA
jgi:hypothetical protein